MQNTPQTHQQTLTSRKLKKHTNTPPTTHHPPTTGQFPCLKANFHMTRRLKAYILTTYLPSLLVVLLSWLSFWIDADSTPARTSLSILTILTVTTQSSSLVRSTPANSFTKASDVWMATCLVFVFAAFIEYSIVNTLTRRHKKAQVKVSQAVAFVRFFFLFFFFFVFVFRLVFLYLKMSFKYFFLFFNIF